MSKKEKRINNGIGDLSFIAALAFLLGIVIIVLNTWTTIKVSIDTYAENKNNNIVEYTKNFIETEKDEGIDRNDIEYIETEKDANMYMISYISDKVIYVIVTIVGTIGFYRLGNFYKKENMENPFAEEVVKELKITQKIMYSTFIVWLIGDLITFLPLTFANAYYYGFYCFDILIYIVAASFIRFIIFILEKGQLKKTSLKSN